MLQKILTAHQSGIKENMYSKKDIENANVENKIPDGMTDETDFVNTLQEVASLIKSTDFSTDYGRTVLGLSLINLCCNEKGDIDTNKSVNVIISMSSHISQLVNALSSIEGIDIKKYFESYQLNVLNSLVEKPVIPYYE